MKPSKFSEKWMIVFAICFLLVACNRNDTTGQTEGTSVAVVETSTSTLTLQSTATYTPTPTYTHTNTYTPTATPTPTNTPTSTPTPTPAWPFLIGTPIPELGEVISPENINRLDEVAHWITDNPHNPIFSPDGKFLVAGAATGIQLFDGETLEKLDIIKVSEVSSLKPLAFSPDGTVLAAEVEGDIWLWQMSDKTLIRKIQVPWEVGKLQFSPDGSEMVAGGWNQASVVRVSTGNRINTIQLEGGIIDVTYLPDGTPIAAELDVTTFKSIRIWQIPDEIVLHTLNNTAVTFANGTFSQDGLALATAQVQGCSVQNGGIRCSSGNPQWGIRLWNIENGTPTYLIPTVGSTSFTFSPDSGQISISLGDGRIQLWKNGRLVQALPSGSAGTGLAYSLNGEILAVSGNDQIAFWQTSNESLLKTQDFWAVSWPVSISPGGEFLATWNGGDVRLMSADDGRPLLNLESIKGFVLVDFAFSPDGANLAAGFSEPRSGGLSSIRVWQTTNGTVMHDFTLPSELRYNDMNFSLDSNLLAVTTALQVPSSMKVFYIYDITDGEDLLSLNPPGRSGPSFVAYLADGETIVSGTNEEIHVWQPEDGSIIRTIARPDESRYFNSIALSPDGKFLVAATRNGTNSHPSREPGPAYIYLWQLSDGTLLHTLEGHQHHIEYLSFSPDGTMLISSTRGIDYPGTTRLWNIEDGALLKTWEPHRYFFAPDGKRLGYIDESGLHWLAVSSGPTLVQDENNQRVIYDNAPATGWEDWSWGGTFKITSSENAHDGNTAIKASLESWGALSLHHSGIDISTYHWLEFYIHVGEVANRCLVTYFNDKNDVEITGSEVNISGPSYLEDGVFLPDQWQRVEIPLEDMVAGTTTVTRLNIKDCSGTIQSGFFIDDIKLIGAIPNS